MEQTYLPSKMKREDRVDNTTQRLRPGQEILNDTRKEERNKDVPSQHTDDLISHFSCCTVQLNL